MNLNGTLSFLEATMTSDQAMSCNGEIDSSQKRWKVAEPIVLADGSIYEGELLDGMKDGRGKIKWPNGSSYEGEWHKDQISGQGTMHMENGDIYQGLFLKGMAHGRGTYRKKNGTEFTGTFVNN